MMIKAFMSYDPANKTNARSCTLSHAENYNTIISDSDLERDPSP